MKKTFLTVALFAAFAAHAAQPDDRGPTPGLGFGNGGQGGNAAQGQLQGQGQAQGQLQGQAQGQVANGGHAAAGAAAGAIAGAASKSASTSGSTATTGAVNASSANTYGSTVTMTLNEAAAPEQRSTTTTRIEAAPTVYAPPAMTTAVCVIGVSAGGSGMGWGFALGSGLKDEGCEVRALSQLLHTYGAVAAAKELLCAHDARVATAYAAAGQPCKAAQPVKTSEAGPPPRIISPYLPG